MAASRRTIWLAVALVAALVVAAIVWTSGGAGPTTPATTAARTARNQPGQAPAQDGVAEVQLDALRVERAEPGDAERNPFRFQARAAPPPSFTSPTPVNQSVFVPIAPTVPAGPPPPPPIPLKFIGIVEQGGKKVAVLSDGKSAPQSGVEGQIILGQYRILKIGDESIEMSYVDGRGRQTIRFTGQ